MSNSNTFGNTNDNIDIQTSGLRRRLTLNSSNPNRHSLVIDCILVYDRTDSDKDSKIEIESIHDDTHTNDKKPSELRRKFEEYLSRRQGLILKHVVSKMNY